MIHLNTQKIVIPIDFSETSMLAVKHGAFLAQYCKGEVFLVHIITRHWEKYNAFEPVLTLENMDEAAATVQKRMEEIAADVRKEHGVEVTCMVNSGNPTKEIVNYAKEIKAGVIVMGTHGYSAWEDLIIGSNALKVITKSPCPVITMSQYAERLGYSRIILPIDSSGHTRQKVVPVMELAKIFSAHVHAIALVGESEPEEKASLEVILRQVEVAAKDAGVACSTELIEKVKNRAITTVKYAESKNADLIAIMTDQDAEISGFFLGPYALQVIHHSKVPVISFKPEEHPENAGYSILSGTSGF